MARAQHRLAKIEKRFYQSSVRILIKLEKFLICDLLNYYYTKEKNTVKNKENPQNILIALPMIRKRWNEVLGLRSLFCGNIKCVHFWGYYDKFNYIGWQLWSR